VRKRLERIWRIIKKLPKTGKIGAFLWLIGYPIGFSGVILLAMGQYPLGIILIAIPVVEGNLGIILMGRGIFTLIKKEFLSRED
jgi:hypothetical protein